MRSYISIAIALFSQFSLAQNIKIQTTERKNPTNGEVYTFPKVVVANSAQVSQKINNALRADILSAPKNAKDANIFDNVWATKSRSFASINDISFESIDINASFISMSISAEGCGAYCEGFTHYYVFNSKTGNQLKLDSIFTKEGVTVLLKNVNANKKSIINEFLKGVNDSLNSPKAKNKEGLQEAKDMYAECLTNQATVAYLSHMQFFIKAGVLTVITERCSSHMNLAIDELMEFKYEVSLKGQKQLTRFGQTLSK